MKERLNCSAVAVSSSGELRVFSVVDLRSWVRDPDWTTLFNLRSSNHLVRGVNPYLDIDFCCPDNVRAENFLGPFLSSVEAIMLTTQWFFSSVMLKNPGGQISGAY